jgi:DNA replication protein DnaC
VNEDAVQIPEHGMIAALRRVAEQNGHEFRPPPATVLGYLLARQAMPEDQVKRAEELSKQADREALELARAARKANRHASYLRTRNPRYAERSFENLKPQQRMGGMVAQWLDSPKAPPTLVMLGRSRAGKTGAAYSIANEAHARGQWVEVITAHGVAEGLRNDKTAVWQRVTECDLLFLDDLGRERVTDWWRDFLQELVNTRHGSGAVGKRMLVTANSASSDLDVAYQELLDRYGDPIVERLMDYAGVLMFDGEPIRTMVSKW